MRTRPARREPDTLLAGKRIFVVEDDPGNKAIMLVLLEMAGAKTSFERWGAHTLDRLRAFAPVDIILLDLMLPHNISGFDIYDQIRVVPAFATVPVVAVSAADADYAVPKARAKGFIGFIAKPISYDQFARQVAQALKNEQVWDYRN